MAAIIDLVSIQNPGYNGGCALGRERECGMVVDLHGYNGLINTRGYAGENAGGADAGTDKYGAG